MLDAQQQAWVDAALPWAQRMANSCRRWWPGAPEDLLALAQEGLTLAVQTYDPERGPLHVHAFLRMRGHIARAANAEIGHRNRHTRQLDEDVEIEDAMGPTTLVEALADSPEKARERAVRWARGEAARLATRDLLAQPPRTPEEILIARESRRRARAAIDRVLATIPAKQVRYVKLRLRDGLPVARVAAELGCSEREARRIAQRVKAALAKAFAAEEIDGPPPSGPPSSASSSSSDSVL